MATEARSYLKSQVEQAKEDIQATFGKIPPLGSCIPDNIMVHYSFDFTQQVHHTCVQQTKVVLSKLEQDIQATFGMTGSREEYSMASLLVHRQS